MAFVISLTYYYLKKRIVYKRWIVVLSFAIYILIHLILFFIIPKESIYVDRWSVITSFWDYAIQGKYPYYATSFAGNAPGPMPFYFVLALPFYFFGEIGLFSLTGLILTIYFFYKTKDKDSFFYILLLLITSPAIFWEISTRSTILINSTLMLIIFYYIKKIELLNKKSFWLTAIFGGLLLSTRTVYSLIFLIWGIYVLKNQILPFTRLFKWTSIFLLSFMFTFVPLIIFYYNDFFIMNPFIIQSSSLIPSNILPFLYLFAIILSFFCKKANDVIFLGGIILFVSILVYFVFHATSIDIKEAFLGRTIDISYFIFSIPFLLYTSNDSKKNIRNS